MFSLAGENENRTLSVVVCVGNIETQWTESMACVVIMQLS